MIEKLSGLRHLKITSTLDKKKHSQQEKKDKHHEEHRQESSEEKKDQSVIKIKNLISPDDFDAVINALNTNNYYIDKGIRFEFHKTNDGDVVFVKSQDKIIQRLTPNKAYELYKRLKSDEAHSPLKGGILNINC